MERALSGRGTALVESGLVGTLGHLVCMSPIEKAESALNTRVATLQANLRAAGATSAQPALFQALLVCLAVGDSLADYVRAVNEHAQARHAELKRVEGELTAQHLALLQAGSQLLEQLKVNPGDKAVRQEIERTKRSMEGVQQKLRRGSYALRNDLAPGIAMIDQVALTIRRFGEADQLEVLKRAVRAMIAHAAELYRSQPGLTARDIVDADEWEPAAVAGIDQATEFQEAYARAGYQTLLALKLLAMALSPTPPETTAEATSRATAAIAERLKATATRIMGD